MQDKELRGAGLKVTVSRMKILEILAQANPHHLSADDIFKKVIDQNEGIAMATVYRVLTQFEQAGLIQRHNFEGGYSVFELNTGDHHDHLVCVTCGTVFEFYSDLIEKQQQNIADQHEFLMKDHDHTIYGLCKRCQ